jgi:hypothetical protein
MKIVKIDDNAFSAKEKTESITLHEGIEEIGYCAFEDCINLKNILLPKGLKKIGKEAFANCENITAIQLPNEIEEMQGEIFGGCKKLKEINLPSSLMVLDNMVFWNSEIEIERLNITPPLVFEQGVILRKRDDNSFMLLACLNDIHESLDFLNKYNISQINKLAFYDSYKLVTAKLPDGLKEVKNGSFECCRNLTTVHFPNGM